MIEDFWDWLPKAYGEVGDEPVFTKYDMEVAFAAGAETEGKRIEQAEQAEQAQPVAWRDMAYANLGAVRGKMPPEQVTAVQDWLEKVYTAPPKHWVGLTGDEVNEFAAGCHLGNSVQGAIRKAEAKLKEKNT